MSNLHDDMVVVTTRRHHPLGQGVEADPPRMFRMLLIDRDEFARLDIPKVQRSVLGPRAKNLIVWSKECRHDDKRLVLVRVCLQRAHKRHRLHIEDQYLSRST